VWDIQKEVGGHSNDKWYHQKDQEEGKGIVLSKYGISTMEPPESKPEHTIGF